MVVLNGISFDIEDWFHVENLKEAISCDQWEGCELRVVQNTRKILRLLTEHQTHATFFILGWVAERCPGLVREIARLGHEIASHGYGHELIYKLAPEAFYDDVRRSKEILESITLRPVNGYRAPCFSITPKSLWAPEVLRNAGFLYDSSVFPTSFHNRYGFNGACRLPFQFRSGLAEIPLSIYPFAGANFPLAGGGYFRLFPYSYFQLFFRRMNKQGQPIVFYLHPWELDPEQPRINVRLNYRFRHYVNLKKTENRLEKLLKDFNFVPLKFLVDHYLPAAQYNPQVASREGARGSRPVTRNPQPATVALHSSPIPIDS
jgi:polysaccharide deacetylase family protein (PEP-CTERM system associated)